MPGTSHPHAHVRSSRPDDYLGSLTAMQAVVLERAEHQHLLRSLRQVLSDALSSAELAERVTAAVGTTLRADRCTIHLALPPGGSRATDTDPHWTRAGTDLPPPTSYAGAPGHLRRLLDGAARHREQQVSGTIAVSPLVARDQLVGWLVVERTGADDWQQPHLELLDEHAPDVAMALMLARAIEDLQAANAPH